MATKKPKTTTKAAPKKSAAKSKTAAKTVTKPVSEAPKTNTVVEKTEKKSCFAGFFAKKYEENESILTVFKNHKFYGALFGEFIGTALLTLLLLAMSLMGVIGVGQYAAFALVAIFIAIYAFSGAALNPLVAVGLMATRRISVIRGIMYIVAEVVGAWLGWLVFNSFHLAGGETAYALPAMAEVGDGQFWIFAMIELLGGIIISFFVARALKYKKSAFTYGATIAGGITLAIVVGYVISAAFFSAQGNFAFNPAVAMMLQIFPTAGENFGEIIGGIGQALAIYALFPMIGGAIGMYISDFASKLSGEE